MRIDGPQLTSSLSLNGTTITDLNVFATTASVNSLTGSTATTGSNLFKGTQTISGSILPAVNNTYDLGSPQYNFRHVYISSGSLYIDGTKVLGSTSQELQITTDTGQSFKILEAGSDTITLQSADGNITLATSGGGDVILDPTTGIIALKGSTQIYAGNRILSSDGNAIHFGNGVTISGSLLATGTNLISGSSQVLNGSGVWSGSAQLPSGIISSSAQLPSGIVSSSAQVTGYGFSTTGSNAFIGTQTITGSLYISSDLVVQGSSSLQNITASAVNIGANIVNLNTANPAIRFAGISVFDSGSIGGSGSFLYDSVQDEFIFIHRGDGTNITSSVVLMGAQTYNNVGSETYPTTNRLLKGTGNEHVGDSIVSETNGGIGISGSLSISGSIIATGTNLVSGSSQIIYSGITGTPSGIISGSDQLNTFGFATTGSNTFTGIQSIGTSASPTSGGNLLRVFGSGSATNMQAFTTTNHATFFEANTNSGSIVTRLQSQTSPFVGTLTNNTFDVVANGAVVIRTTGTGNVGIGVTDLGPDGVSLPVGFNYSWSEGSGNAYAVLFRQRNSAATVVASGYKRSSTGPFASSYGISMARAAIAVGYNNGSIAFFSDAATNVANGTDITPTEKMTLNSSGNLTVTGTINGLSIPNDLFAQQFLLMGS